MTKKITKLLIFVGLVLIGLTSFIKGSYSQGLTTLFLAFAGMYWVEYREAMRYFDSISKRIFVCVDFDAARALSKNLSEQLIFRNIGKEVDFVSDEIIQYYQGNFEKVKSSHKKLYLKRLLRWDYLIQNHAEIELNGHLGTFEEKTMLNYQKQAVDKIEERQYQLLELKLKPYSETKIQNLRTLDNANLHTAELCKIMAQGTKVEKKKSAYLKSAQNLAPNTFISISIS